jgi:hypothetical protein
MMSQEQRRGLECRLSSTDRALLRAACFTDAGCSELATSVDAATCRQLCVWRKYLQAVPYTSHLRESRPQHWLHRFSHVAEPTLLVTLCLAAQGPPHYFSRCCCSWLADADSSEAAIGELQSLADAALSAAAPGRLARVLTQMQFAWVRRCWLQLFLRCDWSPLS